jgi:hypothetical protein
LWTAVVVVVVVGNSTCNKDRMMVEAISVLYIGTRRHLQSLA